MTDFIAEICSNHNGSLARALALIDTAADIGCSGVKFQLFRLDKLYAPAVLNHPDYQFLQERRAWELPLEWLPALANRSQQRGLKFGCTPFYLEAVDELLPYVDFFKIASYNLLHDDLLVKVAKTGKPIVLSTGMGTVEEIKRAIRTLCERCSDLTLLHCVSEYPAQPDSLNPRFVHQLGLFVASVSRHSYKVGWSDHSVSPAVIYYFTLMASVDVIEFHLDLDGQGWEYDIGHCWLPEQFRTTIETVEQLEQLEALPGIRTISKAEKKERLWRADPGDGLRPLKEVRERLCGQS